MGLRRGPKVKIPSDQEMLDCALDLQKGFARTAAEADVRGDSGLADTYLRKATIWERTARTIARWNAQRHAAEKS